MELNFSNDLFLGKIELDFFKKSLQEKGFKRLFIAAANNFGVVRSDTDPSFNAMKVVQGTTTPTISINPGMIIDKNADVIEFTSVEEDVATVPSDSQTYYVKISYAQTTLEQGTIDISASGALSGTNTLFLERLRGLPNFPAKIKFESTNNTGDYTVSSIVSDTSAQLNIASGEMVPETGVRYRVIGTFTPGTVPSPTERYPMKSDGYQVQLTTSTAVVDGLEFILASVSYDGIALSISDMRAINVFSLLTQSTADPLSATNPIIGLMRLMYGGENDSKAYNTARIGWGLVADSGNWSYSSLNNQFTITEAYGGIWVEGNPPTSFPNGSFDGWYVIHPNSGQILRITASSFSYSVPTMTITLDVEATGATIAASGQITIIPPYEGIEVRISGIFATAPTAYHAIYFPIHQGWGHVRMLAGFGYVIRWRYVSGQSVSPWTQLNAGEYLAEDQFDDNGAPTGSVYTTYNPGTLLTPAVHPLPHQTDKMSKTQDNIVTGENSFFGLTKLFSTTINAGQVNWPTGTYNDSGVFLQGSHAYGIINGGGPVNLTGFEPIASQNGQIGIIRNSHSSNQSIVIMHENTGSAAANRIRTKSLSNKTLAPGAAVMLSYDIDLQRWVELF